MERILIKHISGSKANQTDVFLIENNKEIHFGRDPKAEVGFDPEREDLVSRMHARVAQDPADEAVFTITDLESRNGTFVNKNKITGTKRIYPGDTVQFGVGGPEFQFDVDRRPERLTRLAAPHEAAIPTSRREESTESINTIVASAPRVPSGRKPHRGENHAPRPSVGRATLERMIQHVID